MFHDLAHIKTRVGGDADLGSSCGVAAEHHTLDARLRPLRILIQRSLANYEPSIGPGVPPPLAALLRDCLAVDVAVRPTAEGARKRLAALSADSILWPVSLDSGGADGRFVIPRGSSCL